jgi:DNA-binding MarR family transcriptional regulator
MSGQLQTPPQGGAYNIDIDELVDRMASIAVLLDKQYEATRRGELSLIARRALSVVARKENLSVNRVAAEIGRAQSTTSELLARLLKQKLIEQERGKTDGRMVLLRVTDKGRNVLQEVHERRAASWGELLKRLEPVDRTSLVAAMMAVCDALDNE